MPNRHRSLARPRDVRSLLRMVPRRRRAAASEHAPSGITWASAAADDAALQVLHNTLRSACDVIGARGGFVVQLRDDTVLEITCCHALSSQDVLDAVLGDAARSLHRALLEARRGLADAHGELLVEPAHAASPAFVSLPLELGPQHQGALCLLRSKTERTLRALDFEILDALAEQAALALAAAYQRTALSRLEASLTAIGPLTL